MSNTNIIRPTPVHHSSDSDNNDDDDHNDETNNNTEHLEENWSIGRRWNILPFFRFTSSLRRWSIPSTSQPSPPTTPPRSGSSILPITSSSLSNVPMLVVAFSASATTGGTSYAFGLYAAALKRTLHLSQGELDSISTAFFVAGLFSWAPGLVSDSFGTKVALTTGGVTGSITLLLYWAVARQFIPIQNHDTLVYMLSALGIGTFLSCAMVTGAVFKIIVATAGPGIKGSAVGAAKGYVGLGAGLYACIFQAIREPHTSDLDFLPMAAVLFLTCTTLPGLILLPSKALFDRSIVQYEATSRHVQTLYLSLATMAVLIVANSMMNLYESAWSAQNLVEQPITGGSTVISGSMKGSANQKSGAVDDDYMDFSVKNTTLTNHQSKSDFVMGMLLVAIWLIPIATLLVLPREKRSLSGEGDIFLSDDSRDISNNSDLGISSSNTERGLTRRRSRVLDTEDSLSLSNKLSPIKTLKRDEKFDLKELDCNDEEGRGLLICYENSEKKGDILELDHTERNDIEALQSEDGTNVLEEETNLNLYEMLLTKPAMLMLWTTTILVGGGTVMTNSMGQCVESLGFAPAVTPASLALFSVAQALGRVMTGSISEAALNWNTQRFGIDKGIPRPFFLVVASAIAFAAHLVLGLAHSQFVFVLGATLAGLAFGCIWPLLVLITGEVFGTANVGANYMFFDGFTSAAGTLLLTKVIAQHVYEAHIGPDSPDEHTCVGRGCFQNTHMAVVILSLTCIVTSFGVLYTTRHVYNKISLHVA